MFKILIALSLFLAIQGQHSGLPGGYTDHPELIKAASTQKMVKLAVIELAKSQNYEVTPLEVVSVQSQVVNGFNFKIIFNALESTTGNHNICSATIYEALTGAQSVSAVACA